MPRVVNQSKALVGLWTEQEFAAFDGGDFCSSVTTKKWLRSA